MLRHLIIFSLLLNLLLPPASVWALVCQTIIVDSCEMSPTSFCNDEVDDYTSHQEDVYPPEKFIAHDACCCSIGSPVQKSQTILSVTLSPIAGQFAMMLGHTTDVDPHVLVPNTTQTLDKTRVTASSSPKLYRLYASYLI